MTLEADGTEANAHDSRVTEDRSIRVNKSLLACTLDVSQMSSLQFYIAHCLHIMYCGYIISVLNCRRMRLAEHVARKGAKYIQGVYGRMY